MFHIVEALPVQEAAASRSDTTLLRTTPEAVTDDGSVVIGVATLIDWTDDGSLREWTEAFRWTAETGTVGVGTLSDPADPSGFPDSRVYAMSTDGAVLVGATRARDGALHAFRWTFDDDLVDISPADDTLSSSATLIAADGSIVAGDAETSVGYRPFRWTAETGSVVLDAPRGHSDAFAHFLGSDGEHLLGSSVAADGTRHLFVWTEDAGAELLDPIAGYESCEVSSGRMSYGEALAGSCFTSSGDSEAFVWDPPAEIIGLGALDGDTPYQPSAVSIDGSVVVGASGGAAESQMVFRWTRDSGLTAVELPEDFLFAELAPGGRTALSADGSALVGNADAARGFRWSTSDGVIVQPPVAKHDRSTARSVSEDGSSVAGVSTSESDPANVDAQAVVWRVQEGFEPRLVADLAQGSGWNEKNVFREANAGKAPHVLFGVADTPGGVRAWVANLAD
jgi:uncharacterized membrane protein